MRVLLRLFNMEIKAADDSQIPRPIVEKYLQSDNYKNIIKDKLALGGRTHKDRKPDSKYEDIVGPDDQLLISENITHYIVEIFTKPDSPYCYCIIEILDPDKYGGERRDNILNLIADIKSGMMLPCSVVIQAKWDYNDVATEIINIKGVDFTLNPSFKGSGIEKVFSVHKQSNQLSKDSEGNAVLVFSTTAEILDSKTYSKSEVAKVYGLNSPEYKRIRLLDEAATISDQDLHDPINQRVPEREEELDSLGDDNESLGLSDATEDYPDDYWDDEEEHLLSNASSVRDRIYLTKFPRVTLINRILRGYKLYWLEKGKNLSELEKNMLVQLLDQDLNLLIRNVAKKIKAGQKLSTLYALSQFNEDIVEKSMQLSTDYRYLMISEEQLGFIPEAKYKRWKESLINFYKAVQEYCFDGFSIDPRVSINELN